MAGPIVHTVALNQVEYYLRRDLGTSISQGDIIDVEQAYRAILPDIERVHAYWLPETGEGNVDKRIEDAILGLDYPIGTIQYNNAIYRICHYVVDCHSIGHFLGSKTAEVICEPIGEGIRKKDSFSTPTLSTHCKSLEEWMSYLYGSIRSSYNEYGKNYMLHIGPAVRRSVRAGRDFTVELVRMINEIPSK